MGQQTAPARAANRSELAVRAMRRQRGRVDRARARNRIREAFADAPASTPLVRRTA
jgi:hypothetical protein